jgi:hypothetical protein
VRQCSIHADDSEPPAIYCSLGYSLNLRISSQAPLSAQAGCTCLAPAWKHPLTLRQLPATQKPLPLYTARGMTIPLVFPRGCLKPAGNRLERPFEEGNIVQCAPPFTCRGILSLTNVRLTLLIQPQQSCFMRAPTSCIQYWQSAYMCRMQTYSIHH